MQLEGIHHVTAITADARRNLDFYAGTLGLRLVKKSVNQDNTSVYHLFYADETGAPGSDITFFEYPNLPIGRAGAGMIHRIVWRVGSAEAIDFWHDRLSKTGYDPAQTGESLYFSDPEGLAHELTVADAPDEPLSAHHPEIPANLALQGFDGVRAYADPGPSRTLLEGTLGFHPEPGGATWEARGEHRGSYYIYDVPPSERSRKGAGTVHHVAWATRPAEIDTWQETLAHAGTHPTPVIDRHYFRSVYFREPSGVLFELATIGPGFTVDEPLEHLGERLSLTPRYEHLREQIEPTLTPLRNPRDAWARLN
ncbi:MAG: VOC family protein [Solirubrobacterales bacterium]|nr:VOC family protein [Solirubrobacterales bacterium]